VGQSIRVREVPPSRGAAWLREGFGFFRGKPLAWIALAVGWMVITFSLILVPIVGGVIANLLQPVFFASFALAAAKQRAGEPLDSSDLFSGFRRPLKSLATIGAILLLAEIAIFALMSLAGLPSMGSVGEDMVQDYVRALQGKEWILFAGLALTALVKGALWFAPALLAFHEMSAVHAVRWSIYAALSNAAAMVVYGLVLTIVFAAAILPWGAGLLIAVPVMLASTYVGYRDVFEDREMGSDSI
jgi:uncharacterized membrane protein